MARIRTIKPEFPQSESMGRVSREARLCFILLWTILDDEGRARGSSRMLASLLYPYDDDAPKQIERWLSELEKEGCIRRYKIDGDSYVESSNWLKHQKIDKPSKSRLPPEPEHSRTLANPREPSTPDLVSSTLDLVSSIKDQDLTRGFEDFFAAYPKQEKRTKAEAAFSDALSLAPAEAIISGAKRYARKVVKEKTESRFIAFAHNWLAESRWTEGANGNGHSTAFNSPEEIEGQRLARERAEHGEEAH